MEHRSFRLTRDTGMKPTPVAEIRQAFVLGIFLQVIALATSSVMLDTGIMFRCIAIATVGYWCFVIMFALRGARPTQVDLFMIKYGVWPLVVLTVLIGIVLGLIGTVFGR